MREPIHLPQFDRDAGVSGQDLTPTPHVLNAASVAPVSFSAAPAPQPSSAPEVDPSARGWRYMTFALAATLVVGSAVIVATRLGSSSSQDTTGSSLAMQPATVAADPPTVSVHDLPIVGVMVENDPTVVFEEPAATPAREAREDSESRRERRDDEPARERIDEPEVRAEPVSPAEAAPSTEEAPQDPAPALAPFDRAAAASALSAVAGAAASCREPGSPAGAAPVSVTFAPSGRVTTAMVTGGQYAGTSTGGCIARAMRSARVTPFSGDLVTVHKTVTLP